MEVCVIVEEFGDFWVGEGVGNCWCFIDVKEDELVLKWWDICDNDWDDVVYVGVFDLEDGLGGGICFDVFVNCFYYYVNDYEKYYFNEVFVLVLDVNDFGNS